LAETARVHVVIKGIVQGVGYRYFVLRAAERYGLAGWVRNREDGAVEVEAQGDPPVLEAFLKDLRIGPRAAEVTGMDVEKLPPGKWYKGFDLRF
jgi:acylphosphatase